MNDLIEDLNSVGLEWFYALNPSKRPTPTPQQPAGPGPVNTTASVGLTGNYLGIAILLIVIALIGAVIYFVAK